MEKQGILSGHGRLVCVKCKNVIVSCRCMQNHKATFGLCARCAPRITSPEYELLLKQEEEKAPPESSEAIAEMPALKTNSWEAMAKALWGLLDDIDTLDDACRDNDANFRKLVRHIQKRRHEYLVSRDGQTLEVP